MGTEVRPVRFQSGLLEALETRLAREGGELSDFVNMAVDRALHGDAGERRLRAVPEPIAQEELHGACVAYRRALLDRDPVRARAVVDDLVARGVRMIDLYESVLAPAMGEIGELWALEQVTVADEHYATEETAQILNTLAPERRVAPTRGRLAVVGGSPDELHSIGPRMVADLLERAGWEVIALGAGAPAGDLARLVSAECPDVVALSTATVGRLPGAEEAIGLLRQVRPRPLLAVGGGLYRGPAVDLARAWGADVVTSDLKDFLAQLHERFPPVG
ncbi:cobalamin B12-binding domain-containing protein [Conexibacter woesei]|uniref:cobalamin B12-binding domain-containing protein n=1 Tax=Conexibacter woesei TaxID=191495 RepID=UPI0018CA9280|nr:cobalamin-dependent protein [Conexibacter woesei]